MMFLYGIHALREREKERRWDISWGISKHSIYFLSGEIRGPQSGATGSWRERERTSVCMQHMMELPAQQHKGPTIDWLYWPRRAATYSKGEGYHSHGYYMEKVVVCRIHVWTLNEGATVVTHQNSYWLRDSWRYRDHYRQPSDSA